MSIFVVAYIIVDVAIKYTESLIPFAGIVLFLVIFYLTSKHPERVCIYLWNINLLEIYIDKHVHIYVQWLTFNDNSNTKRILVKVHIKGIQAMLLL